jgi:hypothetical protein
MRSRFYAALFSLGVLLLSAAAVSAGLPRMGPPIPIHIVISKPAPDQTYGDKKIVTMGVGDKIYKFVLKDAYADHLIVRWPDIWEYVTQFNPNFVVQGQDADTFVKVQPGQTLNVSGMFAPLDRTFEVMSVEESAGSEGHY